MEKLSFSKYNSYQSLQEDKENLATLKEDKEFFSKLQKENGPLTDVEILDNLAVILDCQEDFHYCAHCPGFDSCDKGQPHYVMSLEKDGPFLKREFSSCHLGLKKKLYQARFLRHDFPDEWNEAGLPDIDKDEKRKPIIAEFLKILKGESKRWIYIQGGPRSGKSFILAVFSNVYAEKNPPIAYCDAPLFIESLKTIAFSKERHAKEALEKAIDSYSRCPLLVLDGFGNEFKSEYVYSTLLYPILSARSKNGLPTFFASDFTIDEVVGDYQYKIGNLRSTQFSRFLKSLCKKEFVLSDIGGLY